MSNLSNLAAILGTNPGSTAVDLPCGCKIVVVIASVDERGMADTKRDGWLDFKISGCEAHANAERNLLEIQRLKNLQEKHELKDPGDEGGTVRNKFRDETGCDPIFRDDRDGLVKRTWGYVRWMERLIEDNLDYLKPSNLKAEHSAEAPGA